MINNVSGIVLRSEDISEHDQRLTLYTKELGKLKAKIVGVKKTMSKLRVLTMPFAELRFHLYLHGNPRAGVRDPGKVVGGEVLETRARLRSDWDRVIQCSAVTEILDVLTHPFYPNSQEYDLLTSTLGQMEETSSPLLVRLRFTLILLKIHGYGLRHHAAWSGYAERDRALLLDLARWDFREAKFSEEETGRMEKMIQGYLSNYLPRPLKTEIFQQKIALAV